MATWVEWAEMPSFLDFFVIWHSVYRTVMRAKIKGLAIDTSGFSSFPAVARNARASGASRGFSNPQTVR